jgi:hypothetical protein
MRRLHVNGESYDFILFDKTLANPNYISVYMNKGNNKITELRAILQRESQN